MIPAELFKKIKRIEITTSRLVTDVFAGQYHSVFKGLGIEFDEVREYQFGDDIRTIDWNVSARTGRPHVKKYVEEREMTVMLMVDASASCRFATVNELKSKLAAEIAAVLAFSAIRNNDKVGLIIFTDKIEKFIPPRKGTKNVLRVIREVLHFKPQSRNTDLAVALEYLNKVTSRKTVAFLISDFFETRPPMSRNNKPAENEEPIYKKALAIANKKHDLIAITLNDPAERSLPRCNLLNFEDAETGRMLCVDSSNRKLRDLYEHYAAERFRDRNKLFYSLGVDHIDVYTDQPYVKEFVKFFMSRRRRIH